MKNRRNILALLLAAVLIVTAAACGQTPANGANNSNNSNNSNSVPANNSENSVPANNSGSEDPAPEKNGDIYILFTSDVHCAVDEGFGYAGLMQIRQNLEAQGYTTLLVDNGDSIQGESLGTLSRGEAMLDLMNVMHYDIAIPGNHEFDYGMDRFLELTKKAEFPYISCNFNKQGELVFKPYVIIEAAGKKIAFVGVTTPKTLTSSTPAYFQDDSGNFIYGFMNDETGEALYKAVQDAVDAARAEGADYVYVLGHMGMMGSDSIYGYADVIEHTSGIDVFLDGHSHDTEQVVMKDRDGNSVVRSACGTKLSCVGYSHISAEKGIAETNIWSWPNSVSLPGLTGMENEASRAVDKAMAELNEKLSQVVAKANVLLTINDPELKDNSGNPIRMVRRAETNLGDLCADAFRISAGTDIGIFGGGGVRANINKGDITYGDIIKVLPFGNNLSAVEASGQQILDALEWGAQKVPGEFGGFLQVSGLTYEIDSTIPSGCKADENNFQTDIEGERRVKNVKVGGEPIDPGKLYTVASTDYVLLLNGDGLTAFDGAKVLLDSVKLDSQMLIEYITETLGGEIGGQYADLTGEDRIVVK